MSEERTPKLERVSVEVDASNPLKKTYIYRKVYTTTKNGEEVQKERIIKRLYTLKEPANSSREQLSHQLISQLKTEHEGENLSVHQYWKKYMDKVKGYQSMKPFSYPAFATRFHDDLNPPPSPPSSPSPE